MHSPPCVNPASLKSYGPPAWEAILYLAGPRSSLLALGELSHCLLVISALVAWWVPGEFRVLVRQRLSAAPTHPPKGAEGRRAPPAPFAVRRITASPSSQSQSRASVASGLTMDEADRAAKSSRLCCVLPSFLTESCTYNAAEADSKAGVRIVTDETVRPNCEVALCSDRRSRVSPYLLIALTDRIWRKSRRLRQRDLADNR